MTQEQQMQQLEDQDLECMLADLDSFIFALRDCRAYIDSKVEPIERLAKIYQKDAQRYIDDYVENKINKPINEKIEAQRQNVLKAVRATYKYFEKQTKALEPIAASDPTNLSKVIDFCMAVKDYFLETYDKLMALITMLPLHITKLTTEIDALVNYRPELPPGITVNLDIKVNPISLPDIMGVAPQVPVIPGRPQKNWVCPLKEEES